MVPGFALDRVEVLEWIYIRWRTVQCEIYIYICSQRVDGLVISIISQAKERGSCTWNHGWLSGWYLSIS